MVEKAVDYIIDLQLRQEMILDEDVSIYRYGYTLVLEIAINIIIAIVIGVLTGELLTVILFLLIFIPLRSFSGGYHALKAWRCTLISCIILTVVVLVEKYDLLTMGTVSIVIIELISGVVIVVFAPLESTSKPLSVSEKRVYKKRAILILAVQLLIVSQLVLHNFESLVNIIVMAHIALMIAQIVGIIFYKYNSE